MSRDILDTGRVLIPPFVLSKNNAALEGFVTDSDDRIMVVNDSPQQRHMHKLLSRLSGVNVFEFDVEDGQMYFQVPASTQSLEKALPLIWARAARYVPLFRQIGTAAKTLCDIGYVHEASNFFGLLAIVPTASRGTNLTVIPPYEERLEAVHSPERLSEIADHIIRGTSNPIAYNSFLDGIEQIGL